MNPTTPFTIIGRCLSPELSPSFKKELAETLRGAAVPWEVLLTTANLHRCTPLWYVRLREHGLLDTLPADLRDYLAALHASNAERNQRIRAELAQVADTFKAAHIRMLLLKGAAVLADDLYGDPGARLMLDLDLLVPQADVLRAKALLLSCGYVHDDPDRLEVQDGRILSRGNHLTPVERPGSPVKIELHYRVLKGRGGQVLPPEQLWATAEQGRLDGRPVLLPAPTERLLHTTLHGTLPGKEFIRSHLGLAHLAEFAALCSRLSARIDVPRFWQIAGDRRVITEAATFTGLARKVLRAQFETPPTLLGAYHMARMANLSHPAQWNRAGRTTRNAFFWRVLQRTHYYLSMPRWAWTEMTLTSERARRMGLPAFLWFRIADRSSWGKYVKFEDT
jgi:hypothetical protein